MLQCIYVHGFASGPSSTKAAFFSSNLRRIGFTVHVPDMNGDNFSDLTISNQLQLIESNIQAAGSDVFAVGSSMGSLLSVLASQRLPAIKALILMAPGFGLNRRWPEILGPDRFNEWKQRGTIDTHHHGFGREMPLKFSMFEDATKHQTENLRVAVPTLVMHGVNDTVVPCEESKRFHELNSDFAELHMLNSDHGLTDCLPMLWTLTEEFMARHQLLPDRAHVG
jgi:hypothetical protein